MAELPSDRPATPHHKPSSDSSTPYILSRTSLEASSGTHSSIDRYLLDELNGRVLVDIGELIERWVLPDVGRERMMFDKTVSAVVEKSLEKAEWEMPLGFSDRIFLPWLGRRMRDVSKWAVGFLVDDRLGEEISGLTLDEDSPPASLLDSLVSAWLARLRSRTWAVKPGNMVGSRATRAVDILLSATPDTKEWASALVIGEHKPDYSLGQRRKSSVQLAGYAGELFGVQPFRQFVPGFTILHDKMQVWIHDRMGSFASESFSVSTEQEHSRRKLVETTLAFALMDELALGFDGDVFSDAACTTTWSPTAPAPSASQDSLSAYIKLQGQIFHLRKVLFIRPGLVCRGTRCFQAFSPESADEVKEYIVKMSWRFEDLRPEGMLLEKVGSDTRVRNVVRMHAFDEGINVREDIRKGLVGGTPFELKPPRLGVLLSNKPEKMQSRVLTRTVLKDSGRPLSSAESALELVQGIRDAFIEFTDELAPGRREPTIGHGTLYFHSTLLHRDISRSNILLRSSPLPSSSDSKGFLIDLDYAVSVDPETLESASSGAPHRTGTLPYMAIDILDNNYDVHLYHHDVESFLYVLLWCCVYGPEDSGYLPPPTDQSSIQRRASAAMKFLNAVEVTIDDLRDPLALWRKGKFEVIGTVKRKNIGSGFEQLLALLRRGFDAPPMLKLIRDFRSALFGTVKSNIILPSERVERGWSGQERRKDERILFDSLCEAMEKAIRAMRKNSM